MKEKMSVFTRGFTWLLILVFSAIAVGFLPHFADYLTAFLAERGFWEPPAWSIYVFGAAVCLPCVGILLLALGLSDAVARDAVFTLYTAKRLHLISRILFWDCVVFFMAISALFFVGEWVVSVLLALVCLVGLALSVLLRILAGYIARAAWLKEEVDATL